MTQVKEKDFQQLSDVTVRFAGDSGDGMQLTGTQFSDTTAWIGNDLNTLPDYPAEIRAPAGTLYGVSGFQLHFSLIRYSAPRTHELASNQGDTQAIDQGMGPAGQAVPLAPGHGVFRRLCDRRRFHETACLGRVSRRRITRISCALGAGR